VAKNRVAELWPKYAQKIAEAERKDAEQKGKAFLPLPYLIEDLGEFEVVPLTLRKYAMISLPGFWEKDNGRLSVLRFLWILSPEFEPSKKKAQEFLDAHRFTDLSGYDEQIRAFIGRAFELAPQKNKDKPGKVQEWLSHFVDIFAKEYGWTDDQILDAPMARLWLYLRRIRDRSSKTKISFCEEADRLRQQFMDEVNNSRN
jgi:hypothetical protein